MNDALMTKDDEVIRHFFASLERMSTKLEHLATDCRPPLNGERFLTDCEVARYLKVSRRTLQDYRNEGRIPYILLGGKVLYRESDIEKVLEEGYREAFRMQDSY